MCTRAYLHVLWLPLPLLFRPPLPLPRPPSLIMYSASPPRPLPSSSSFRLTRFPVCASVMMWILQSVAEMQGSPKGFGFSLQAIEVKSVSSEHVRSLAVHVPLPLYELLWGHCGRRSEPPPPLFFF